MNLLYPLTDNNKQLIDSLQPLACLLSLTKGLPPCFPMSLSSSIYLGKSNPPIPIAHVSRVTSYTVPASLHMLPPLPPMLLPLAIASPVPETIRVYLESVWNTYRKPAWISSMMCCVAARQRQSSECSQSAVRNQRFGQSATKRNL